MQFALPFEDPRPFGAAQGGPFGVAQGRPSDAAQGGPVPEPVPVPAPGAAITQTGEPPPALDSVYSDSVYSDGVYFVRNQRARRYIVRVDRDGRVRVTIPRGGSKRDGSAFVLAQREWVRRQQARLGAPAVAPADVASGRVRAATELPARLLALAAQHGLAVSRVSIRSQRTRWGSCGPDGHISLNWRLVLMPGWVRDYVLIHELMHLRRLDHSPAYWRLVEAACPDYRLARRWLRLNGAALR